MNRTRVMLHVGSDGAGRRPRLYRIHTGSSMEIAIA